MNDSRIHAMDSVPPLKLDGLPRTWHHATGNFQQFVTGVDALRLEAFLAGRFKLAGLLGSGLRQWPIQLLVSYASTPELPPQAFRAGELEKLTWVIAQDLVRALLGGRRPRFDKHLLSFVSSNHSPGGWLELVQRANRMAMEDPYLGLRPLVDDLGAEERLLSQLHAQVTSDSLRWLGWDDLLRTATSASWNGFRLGRTGHALLLPPADGLLTSPGRLRVELRLADGTLLRFEVEVPGEVFGSLTATVAAMRGLAGRRDDEHHFRHLPEHFADVLPELLGGSPSDARRTLSKLVTTISGAALTVEVGQEVGGLLRALDGLVLGGGRAPGEPLPEGTIVGLRDPGTTGGAVRPVFGKVAGYTADEENPMLRVERPGMGRTRAWAVDGVQVLREPAFA